VVFDSKSGGCRGATEGVQGWTSALKPLPFSPLSQSDPA
jgi:hypothetical protein